MTTTHCPHHWIIEAANGPVSTGRCRLCGEEREFSNSTEFRSGSWTSQPQQYPRNSAKIPATPSKESIAP